jgi:hypothetical protein
MHRRWRQPAPRREGAVRQPERLGIDGIRMTATLATSRRRLPRDPGPAGGWPYALPTAGSVPTQTRDADPQPARDCPPEWPNGHPAAEHHGRSQAHKPSSGLDDPAPHPPLTANEPVSSPNRASPAQALSVKVASTTPSCPTGHSRPEPQCRRLHRQRLLTAGWSRAFAWRENRASVGADLTSRFTKTELYWRARTQGWRVPLWAGELPERQSSHRGPSAT